MKKLLLILLCCGKFINAQNAADDPFVKALKSGKRSELMKHYVNQDEMAEGSWLIAQMFMELVKSKKKITKEEFKQEFIKSGAYYHERKKMIAWLDTFLLDSTRYDWKKMKFTTIEFKSAWEYMLEDKKLSHKDSVRIKTLPGFRIICLTIENDKEAWTLEIPEAKFNKNWKFLERPGLKFALTQSLLDTMFRAALKAYYIDKSLADPYVRLHITDTATKNMTEICLPLRELELDMIYFKNLKREPIAPGEIFKVYENPLKLNTKNYDYMKDRHAFSLEKQYHHERPRNSKELLNERFYSCGFSSDCSTLAAWLFERGVLLSYDHEKKVNERLLVLDLKLAD